MYRRRNYVEKGMTLVEVLSGIVILSIVLLLITPIFNQIFKSESASSESTALKKDTNVIINQLRSEYYSNDTSTICSNHIGDGITVNLDKTRINNGEFNEDGTCIHNIDKTKALELNLVTQTNHMQKEVEISTTFEPLTPDTISSNDISILNPNSISFDVVDKLPCETDKNIEWTGESLEKNCENNLYNVDGHLLINKENNVDFQDADLVVEKNFYVEDDLVLENIASLEVKGDAWFDTQLTLERWGDPKIIVNKNALFSEQVDFKGTSQLIVKKNVEFSKDGVTFEGNAKLFVDRNALFKGQSTFNGNQVEIVLRGHAKFERQTTLNSGAEVVVGKSVELKEEMQGRRGGSGKLCASVIIPSDGRTNLLPSDTGCHAEKHL